MTNQKMDWELTSENSKIEYVTILIRLYALSTKTLIYQDLVSAGIFLKWLNKQTQLRLFNYSGTKPKEVEVHCSWKNKGQIFNLKQQVTVRSVMDQQVGTCTYLDFEKSPEAEKLNQIYEALSISEKVCN